MRYDTEHKAKTHRKIVKGASRQLRKKGLSGPAVATLMKASGLTHGGFYKHFPSRDALLIEAIEESFRDLTQTLLDAAEDHSESRKAWQAMIETYLSIERCDRPEIGCPMAALAPEMARTSSSMKQRISAAIMKFRADLMPSMPGRTPEEKSANFLMIITSMVGTIAIARNMPDLVVRQRILNTVRDRLIASF